MMDRGEPISMDYAVLTTGVTKKYGKVAALQDVDMHVPRGSIYVLMGPSGCGKTTLLRSIVGSVKINTGCILTLDKQPGSLGHGVPGVQVGYMPQELALYQDFSICETLTYFGRLHRMNRRRIADRIAFLVKFMNLPGSNWIIKKLSGGQQRRTSFAIALLHEPELLILDEPTVGVDPLLRERIWKHLLGLSEESHATIIITTHYIEEASQSQMVGLMRNGRLLKEAQTQKLLQEYQTQSLEKVFYKVCEEDEEMPQMHRLYLEQGTTTNSNYIHTNYNLTDDIIDDSTSLLDSDEQQPLFLKKFMIFVAVCWAGFLACLPSPHNIFALIIKNVTILKRQIGALVFQFLLPSFQIVLFCVCLGRDPHGINMSVVNLETNGSCTSGEIHLLGNYSCNFLYSISNYSITQHNFHSNLTAAVESVKAGHSWGVIEVPKHFSVKLLKKFIDPGSLTPEDLNEGVVNVYMDASNELIYYNVTVDLINAMQTFLKNLLTKVGRNPALADIPIIFRDPIYGSNTPSFTNFMVPGIILSITAFMATGLTALSFVLERRQGLLDRTFVAGATTLEIMIGHIVTQFLVMVVQVALLLTFALTVFNVPLVGSLGLVIFLTLLQGLVGMALGLLISTLCDQENTAIQCALGTVYPNILLSGIIWPIEGLPRWMQYMSYGLPMTYAADAMRGLLARGWPMTHPHIWRGFVMSVGWWWALMIIVAILLKVKKN